MAFEIDIKTGLDTIAAPGQSGLRGWRQPHRIVLIAVALALVAAMALTMRWSWLPIYAEELALGL